MIEEEVSEDSNEPMEQEEDSVASENTQKAQPIVDVPFTITNEVPEDSQPVDEQLTLF